MQRSEGRASGRLTLAIAALLALAISVACRRRSQPESTVSAPSAPSALAARKPPPLPRLTTSSLCDAYADGADATYRGKRYTLIGSVVSSSVDDAGVQRVVLGSRLQPVIATGLDSGAALALIPDSAIEIDCTVTGSLADTPQVDCGPSGVPRPVSNSP